MKEAWLIMKLKLAFGTIILTLISYLLFPKTDFELKSQIPKLGEVASKSIISTRNFDVPKKQDEFKREQDQAREKVLFVFEEDNDKTLELRIQFEELIEDIKMFSQHKKKLTKISTQSKKDVITSKSALLFNKITRQISQGALYTLGNNLDFLPLIQTHFNQIIEKGVSNEFIAPNQRNLELYKKQFNLINPKNLFYNQDKVYLIKDDQEKIINTKDIRTAEIRVENHFEILKPKVGKKEALLSAIYETLYASVSPNIYFMAEETQSRQQKEANQVLPIKGKVLNGTEIVGAGEIISQSIIDKIKALQVEQKKDVNQLNYFFPNIGIALLYFILSAFYFLYLYKRHPRWVSDDRFFLALTAIPALQVALISYNIDLEKELLEIFSNDLFPKTSTWYLVPFSLASVIGTVLFSFEIGLIFALLSGTYAAMLTGFDFNTFITASFTSLIISWQLNNLRYRGQFLWAAFAGSCTMIVCISITSLLRSQFHYPETLIEFGYGSINILITIALSGLIIIPLFERVFKITTNLVLMELSDFNHPALRLISINAPSTFHHSIMVANLAEKAVERIGGNALLVRVMALYHDIGKTLQPEYFTENQRNGKNKHDDIKPDESATIIADHVRKAITLAEKYRLPPLIISGIPEHHGTGLIKYFYHKAKEQGLDPDIEDYQYGGPKPQRKETVALMAADAIEATTRSLKNPTGDELREVVKKVIQTRLYEDQFDESGVTLKELKEMEIGFCKALEGMFHTRIAYPNNVWFEKPKN